MNVIGLTTQLSKQAEQQCGGRHRAWLKEIGKGKWANWSELLGYYPNACRTTGNEAHFPLATDGTGIRANVFFPHGRGIMRLLRVAPKPTGEPKASARPARRATPLSRSV
ncbi:MAG: hypothetical protein Q7R22_011060 [Verrucomicrobiota bacterium JB025]|nr:hypothetical protein [Verrucomicrobiota bacterium JB025]